MSIRQMTIPALVLTLGAVSLYAAHGDSHEVRTPQEVSAAQASNSLTAMADMAVFGQGVDGSFASQGALRYLAMECTRPKTCDEAGMATFDRTDGHLRVQMGDKAYALTYRPWDYKYTATSTGQTVTFGANLAFGGGIAPYVLIDQSPSATHTYYLMPER